MTAIESAKNAIKKADAILIGASNGLSIAEGYNIFADNDMFRRQFDEFIRKFSIRSVIDGSFYQYPSPVDREAFMDTLVHHWVTNYQPSDVMKNLRSIVDDKPYFILTTNGDTHLEISGFDKSRIWEIEGTFVTGMHTPADEDGKEGLLHDFIRKYSGDKLVILELGIGSRNTIIKQPLMQLTAQLPNATYITMNLPHEIFVPKEIKNQAIELPGDISRTLQELVQ